MPTKPQSTSAQSIGDYTALLRPDTYTIFLFHGVVRQQRHRIRNYTVKHLELRCFEHLLDALGRAGNCVSMDEIADATLDKSALPPNAFAITFDDGFANNLEVAAPALSLRALPATFYITSGFVDSNSASWIDLIEYAFELCEDVSLELPLGSRAARTDEAKLDLLDELRSWLKRTGDVDPYEIADEIAQQLGVREFEPDAELDRKLTWKEVRKLAGEPEFTVGGHGHTHRILERLSDRQLEAEIAVSLARQEEHLGAISRHYSYPEGLADCYSERVIEMLRARGIVCCPSAQPGVNHVGDDLFHLRRVMVPPPGSRMSRMAQD